MMLDSRLRGILEAVPDDARFLTVDEMTTSSHRLAEDYPDLVEILPLGHSRAGYPIEALKIGHGSQNAMLVGLPHPNEPIGAMMLEFLSRRLAEDADLRAELDMTWFIIKCIDPDGTKLNEGWFSGPFTITHYARNFYRPPGEQQVEWTFPIDYKTYSFNSPLPETQAWMKLIEQHPPDFMYSLHNAGFGGVYLYLSHDMPTIYPSFYELVDYVDLPLHLGEPEMPFVKQFERAVFGMIGMRDQYDYMSQNLEGDPAEYLTTGASSYEYMSQFKQPTFLICEMPYFYNPSIHDTSESDAVRRDVVLASIQEQRRKLNFMQDWLDKLDLQVESAFRDAVTMNVKTIPDYLNARENQTKADPDMERKATVAEKFDNQFVSRFYYLLMEGVFLRMIETEIAAGHNSEILSAALRAAIDEFESEAAYLEANMNYTAIPIRKLVQTQLGTALLILQDGNRS